jgi:formylglycine-generating enzyme required for sulfatase activity
VPTPDPDTPDPTIIAELLNSIVAIPAGAFMMGQAVTTWDIYGYTTVVHEVTLQGFGMSTYEITQAQYETITGINPSECQGAIYGNTDNYPVEQTSQYDALAFCVKLSELTGRTFTLPSEAQWEYACRAGTSTLYSFGDDNMLLYDYAWFGFNNYTDRPYGPHPVGIKLPNPWGLYDMHGNVWEMCLDSWHYSYVGAPTDGSAWESGLHGIYGFHVQRGGSFNNDSPWVTCQSTYRNVGINATNGGSINGFRIVEIY